MIKGTKRNLSSLQQREIRLTIENRPAFETLEIFGPEYFLLNFVYFESLTRLLLRYADSSSKGYSPIRIDSVRKAYRLFGLDVTDNVLIILLDSKSNKSGKRSARLLRNALVHSWAKSARQEVMARHEELNRALQEVFIAFESNFVRDETMSH